MKNLLYFPLKTNVKNGMTCIEIHKTMGGSSYAMCGDTTNPNNRTNTWELTTCKRCLKNITNYTKKRIAKKTKTP